MRYRGIVGVLAETRSLLGQGALATERLDGWTQNQSTAHTACKPPLEPLRVFRRQSCLSHAGKQPRYE